jgi:calcium/calmodulin-dependent protein kinase I
MASLDHPNIVRLFEIFDEDNILYLVMEIMKGGELFDRIVEKESYTEKEACETIRPLVDAIRYCHDNGIIHRDLKPENLLYETTEETSIIKISDFGLARFCENELAFTAAGTPGYVAPELVEGKGYGKEVDYWSLGVILYVMLCGYPPFYDENNTVLFQKILNLDYEFASPYWDEISDSAKDLIKHILTRDPAERYDAEQILNHPWIVGDGCSEAAIASIPE